MSRKSGSTSLLLENTEQREPLLTEKEPEFVSYDDEEDIQRRIRHSQKTARRNFSLFVILAVVVIAAVGVGLYFLSDNVKYQPSSDTPPPSSSILAKYRHAAIASDNKYCSDIGKHILQTKKGSSVDAAIAVLACYSVVQPQNSGLGGGFFMTVYNNKTRKATSIDARETAPGGASQNMYKDNPKASEIGGLSIAVPGEVAGYWEAHKKFGKLPWSEIFKPAINLAREGFVVGENLRNYLEREKDKIYNDTDLKHTYTDPKTGKLWKASDTMKLLKQARTLQIIANDTKGTESFYRGQLSQEILQDLKEKGSNITATDLANYKVIVSDSLHSVMRDGSTLYAPPAPSGGPVLIFIMNILDGYGIKPSDLTNKKEKLLAYHRITEAFKFAYAKRTDLGDPDFEDVQKMKFIGLLQMSPELYLQLVANLISPAYADTIRSKIWDNQTHTYMYYGPTYYDKFKTSTAHLSIAGPDGLAVSVTSTVNLRFGSGVMGHRTGVLFNDEMDDFSSPNQTNFFGVAPSPSNFIKPGKRPLSSMCPAVLVTKDNQIKMVVGAAGGTRITTATAYVMLRVLWFGDNIKEAVDSRRIHDQLLPPLLEYEEGFDQYFIDGLRALGHNVTLTTGWKSIVEAIYRDKDWFFANSDFRRLGSMPAGY